MYEIISRKKQDHWRLQTILNFILGGMGAGLYIMIFFFGQSITWEESIITAQCFKLISTVLVAAGFLAVATEAGRPMRGLYLFTNITHSWMSREVLFAGLFILLSFSELTISSLTFRFFATLAAVLFILSQAMILYSSSAVPAWNRPMIPLFFIASALLNGFGLFLLLQAVNLYFLSTLYSLKFNMLVYGIICICSTLTIWLWIVYTTRDEKKRQAIWPLRSNRLLIGEVGIGGLLPMVGLAVLVLQGNSPAGGFTTILIYAVCSGSILFGGFYRLCRLVINIDYLRPVWIDKPSKAMG